MQRTFPIWILLIALLMTSCATSKHITSKRHTVEVRNATISVTWDKSQHQIYCTSQTVCDSVVVLSFQAMPGMEMAQVRATQDSVYIINRLKHEYSTMGYSTISKITQPALSYRMLEKIATGGFLRRGMMSVPRTYHVAGHTLTLTITYPEILRDQPMRLRTARINQYKRTTSPSL